MDKGAGGVAKGVQAVEGEEWPVQAKEWAQPNKNPQPRDCHHYQS